MDYLAIIFDQSEVLTTSLFDIVFGTWLANLFWLFLFFIFLLIIRRIILQTSEKNRMHDHVIYLVKVPKDRPGDKEKELSIQELREMISRGETIFASIGGLRAMRGFKAWLFGRNDHYSFEIVAQDKKNCVLRGQRQKIQNVILNSKFTRITPRQL